MRLCDNISVLLISERGNKYLERSKGGYTSCHRVIVVSLIHLRATLASTIYTDCSVLPLRILYLFYHRYLEPVTLKTHVNDSTTVYPATVLPSTASSSSRVGTGPG
jgi:hypothetical protein